ncbi:DUF4831 family protein [Prolixibacteraceae bacterium Z1-6]|uniref:DUF4831 family protein n=1 Tax=Draconibacterium aestuarii TaxID=2998507 RepID=A0A9X3J6L0_9BACT|nr:DUF4831 family protein [Prolixibacteraceae bacterium Z1-6]
MKYLAILVCLMFVIPTYGQRKKKDDEAVVTPAYVEGIAYALPRTGIKVHVKAIREVFVPGPYAAYAEQLLGITNAKNRATTSWSISEVKIETFSEPDPEQVYKAMGDGAFMLNLAPNGCLAGINSDAIVTDLPAMQSNKTFQKPDIDDGFSFDYFTDTPTYYPGDSTNNFRPSRVSVEQKAAEAAKRILNCRMNQYDLAALRIDGEYPDGKAYEVSLEELKRTEKNYITLFVGRTTYKKESYSFDYVPESKPGKGQVIFRISDEKGLVSASDLSGKPVMIEFEQDQNLVKKYAGEVESQNPAAGKKGVYYRMPGVATVRIINDMNVIATARTTIAQFGSVAPVPEELLQGDCAVEFHPETGAIKSVSIK